MLTARPINAQTWNLATDFSATNNPNGVWSYGAKEATLSADLILYTDTTAIPAHYGTQQLAGWTNPATGIIPYVAKNTSAQDWNYDGTSEGGGPAVLHPQEVLLHPSSFGNRYSVVRWTAPRAGRYAVSALFRRFENKAGVNSSYAVLQNGVALPEGSGILTDFDTPDSSVNYTNASIALNEGDVLEFAVGIGTDGTSNTDGTTL